MGDICNYIETLILLNLCRPLVVSTQKYSFTFDNEVYEYPIPRVVNGQKAELGQFPYQIALKQQMGWREYMTFCGGALIGPNKILSAAHCLVTKGNWCERFCFGRKQVIRLQHKYAVAGTLTNKDDRRDRTVDEQWRKMTSALIPTGYEFPTNDIALAFTRKPFHMNKNVDTLPIAQKTIDYGDIGCIVSGYGRLSRTELSSHLMWAELQLINMRECDNLYREDMSKLICISSINTSVLQGDSGGPLVCFNTSDPNDAGQGVVVGVVSALSPLGAVFCRVSSYYKFLQKNNASIPTINVTCLCIIVSYYIKIFV